jgi:hypothetical protein
MLLKPEESCIPGPVLLNVLHFSSIRIAIFNTSEQSSAFNHEYGSWASEPKARQPYEIEKTFSTTYLAPSIHKLKTFTLLTSEQISFPH